ncbi:molybdopterin-guanine dinucleotide biosynthesis protein B [Variovorax boronicumulans]|uniref:molybdopterin-guanine dinucleotide biosynthesis protein B n=1 Tax=Variovorax boronicumulans TaxID=436515 RepID=UPI0027862867|nr:molybdopterin-guanine dinucleotide biosynthesis protein B [Variovorax boronicumulans]MDP9995378.1 molybdopterin-guanine dinucleotide biosynthesis protein B [Variovorax boronicumulans]MDQ0006668.1 molybdopterin-guanine dinucleotide biosynthesis protein B [Variovorax boronicumulans]MDQ0039891.1 molybdopterin-guanine dinucleotide biosynthesis protein B [Variovorax boronicumulans]
MKVVGFAGYSGAGKTTLVEKLIPVLKRLGQRVSVVKHAHHKFDIDHPGKDTYRHREAGAFEVVVASDKRLAVMREFETPVELSVHQLLAEVHPVADWVLVEGFRHGNVHKIEVWRQPGAGEALRPVLYPDDPFVTAIATDAPDSLPEPTARPLFDLDDAEEIARWLIANGERFEYNPEHHG